MRFLKDQRGQGIVEYLVILSATAVACGFLYHRFISILDQGLLRLGAQLEKDLKTGRADIRVWKN